MTERERSAVQALIAMTWQYLYRNGELFYSGDILAGEQTILALAEYRLMTVERHARLYGKWNQQAVSELASSVTLREAKMTERERNAVQALVAMTRQCLQYRNEDLIDSRAMSAGEQAILALAEYGLMTVERHGRIFGRWNIEAVSEFENSGLKNTIG